MYIPKHNLVTDKNKLDKKYKHGLLNGIVTFKVTITDLQAKRS
ncbi:MAG TPA: hypothetical protein VK783_00070 [Bacteroidia bacterium]|jgi:hypothetical protein|nr:hypothetical protein [Bacteroidia bacterium]